MRNDQDQVRRKQENEEFFRERMDPACPGCHQRIVSQGCVCSKPKPKPQAKGQSKTPGAKQETNSENEKNPVADQNNFSQENAEMSKNSWFQEKDGSFTYISPQFFSMNVHSQNFTLFFSKNSPDFEKVYEAFHQFEFANNLIVNKDFTIQKTDDRLIIRFSNQAHYENFINHLLNKTPGLSDELRTSLRTLPKPQPKASKKSDEEENKKTDEKSKLRSPFRIPDPNQGPNPYDS